MIMLHCYCLYVNGLIASLNPQTIRVSTPVYKCYFRYVPAPFVHININSS